jgi:DNA topoisomerase-1
LSKHLVIVESPTKSKKIQEYLPKGYVVDSCVGHIRDLPASKEQIPDSIRGKPWADFGVDIEHDFAPFYVTIPGKDKVLKALKAKLKDADSLFLATDEDREGESISWHLQEVLKPKVPVRRMVFNEITKEAIRAALENPRAIDMNLVQAQETRRILDRLYGYALSPLLWKKIGGNLSAGRVQSVAVRLVVMRERERRAFRQATYWDLEASLVKGGEFVAKLVAVGGKRVATSKDFDKETGKLAAGRDVLLLEEAPAKALQEKLLKATWSVADVAHQARQSSPDAPFVTATLQQEANNRLGLSAKEAMSIAQRLFENGFITYMRTDSTALSEEAVKGARDAIKAQFGDQYLGPVRTFEGKQQKGAQEAHEAIRPAGAEFVHPERADLRGKDQALYRLIWQRTLASQMPNERYISTTATIEAASATFTATGKTVEFDGYRAVYAKAEPEDDDGRLPELAKGDKPKCKEVRALSHETKPPARFTEASLVKALVDERIGRPSTYASILDTIQSRGYVANKGKALVPTFTAFAVVGLLEKHFPQLVDLQFTAEMEEKLDLIASGEKEWVPFLADFFLGKNGLQAEIARRMKAIDPADAREIDLGSMPFKVKVGRFGAYVEAERGGEIVRATVPESITPDELTEETLDRLLTAKAEGPKSIGEDPETGLQVFVLDGRFGPYYQLGLAEGDVKPKRASLPRGKKVEDANMEEALFLLRLPRDLGPHPGGGRVIAGLGRFGPYVAWAQTETTEYRSIQPPQLASIQLDEAIALLSQPKAPRAGGRFAPRPLREMGPHPRDGKPVLLMDGKYGAYVKHGDTNATVPKGTKPEELTMEQAVSVLDEREARGPAPKKKGRRR